MSDNLHSDGSTRKKTLRLRDPIPSNKCFPIVDSNSRLLKKDKLSKDANKSENETNIHRASSLDSLNNSSDQEDSIEENVGLYSDSDPEIAHITGTTSAQIHRRSDLEELKVYSGRKSPESSTCDCDCNSIRDSVDSDYVGKSDISQGTVSSTSSMTSSVRNTRRASVASSGSVGRMETILEEPIEPKISVKEILARFETLNSSEVNTVIF